jgi:hypothetical protein
MPTAHRDQLSTNFQMHLANIQSEKVQLLYNRGTAAPRAYRSEQGSTCIQKQEQRERRN